MTVMLLQRSASPQSTQSLETTNNNNNNSTNLNNNKNNFNGLPKSPFLFLLEEGNNITNNNKIATINRNNSVQVVAGVGVGGVGVVGVGGVGCGVGNLAVASTQSRLGAGVGLGGAGGFGLGGLDTSGVGIGSGLGGASGNSGGNQQIQGEGIAMRYYRLWIYACNVVLLGSALGFVAAGARTLIFSGDARRRLVPGVPGPFDLTTLYAILALAAQLGLVQLLGCVAARRLSARLLNAYWLLLLGLLFGDAFVGVAWVFRYEKIRAELRPTLRLKLQTDYGKDERFTEQWDRLQREFNCCGVYGAKDYILSKFPPHSCCSATVMIVDNFTTDDSNNCQQPFQRGCDEALLRWLRRTADLLFVLGFCVIAFTKLCFLGILRYEIREMIQKIKLLREPPPPATTFAQPTMAQIIQQDPTNNNNGSILRRTNLQNNTTNSGNTTLLLQSDDCGVGGLGLGLGGGRHPLLGNALQQQQDGGADSDTNSHCALILEETTSNNQSSPGGNNYKNFSNSCGTTAMTMTTTTTGVGGFSGKDNNKTNGNNNYEMREFNRRLLFSNGNSQVIAGSTGTAGTANNNQIQQNRNNNNT